jgi:hypothetical protein
MLGWLHSGIHTNKLHRAACIVHWPGEMRIIFPFMASFKVRDLTPITATPEGENLFNPGTFLLASQNPQYHTKNRNGPRPLGGKCRPIS